MKKFWLTILVITISYITQSQIPQQVNQLATLGKLWGFLKYYHSAALKGRPDWDKELVRMAPLAEQSAPGKAFDKLMEDWYRSLPSAKFSSTAMNRNADSIMTIFSEKDIQQFALSGFLKKELIRLYQYHIPDTSRYVTRYYRNHLFDHIIHTEDSHSTPVYPSKQMRLLALFRYWNTINYFYPHKQRIAGWDKVLTKYIPRFIAAKDSLEYRYVIRELIHELPDSHSFMQQPGDVYRVYPFRLDYIEGKYIIGQCDAVIAKNNDYRLGDEVIGVNGKTILEREKELLKITTGTNDLSLHRNIAQTLFNDSDFVVQVQFKRKDSIFSKQIVLHTWETYNKLPRAAAQPLWRHTGDGIWYVRFCRITNPDTLTTLFRDIHNAKAVIWDMRDYPSYNVTLELYKFFFSQPVVITEERNASDFFPGSFIKSPYSITPATVNDSLLYKGPMIVLIDERTQSLSESVTATLLLRPNIITMGRQTAGTTGNITWISLPGDIAVSYTGVGVIGSHQTFVQGGGVRLDKPISLTVANVIGSNDYILERAVEFAKSLSSGNSFEP